MHRVIRSDLPDSHIRKIVRTVFQEEGRTERGVVSIVLTDDATLQELNTRFFRKSRPTDVIAFPLHGRENFLGEIYISMERVKENSMAYHVSLSQELARYIIHGILHLLGYEDKTQQEKKRMQEKEDGYLKKLSSLI